jgi:predicted ATP-grasp superfamily ATP-dependent carboligase
VLVTQGAMKHSLAIIQHLAAQGYAVSATVPPNERRALARLSRHTTSTFVVEEQRESICLRDLLNVLRAQAFNVLIPVGYPVTEFVAKHAEELGQHVRFMSPGETACTHAGDKYAMAQFAASLGLAVPNTYAVTRLEDLDDLSATLSYPVVIKGRHEAGQKIIAYARDRAELHCRFRQLCQEFGLDDPARYPIVQEYIPGWGCGFFALYQHGVPKRIFMHRRIREYPVSGGASSCAESFFDPELMALGRSLLDALRWHGVAMVECRFDTRTQRFTLIEVNAKFWGSLELALRAGADFAGDYVRGALGEPLGYSEDFQRIRFQWPFDGDVLHATENTRAWGAVLRDFLSPSVAKGYHWTDPVPTLAKMYGAFCGIAVGLRAKLTGPRST